MIILRHIHIHPSSFLYHKQIVRYVFYMAYELLYKRPIIGIHLID